MTAEPLVEKQSHCSVERVLGWTLLQLGDVLTQQVPLVSILHVLQLLVDCSSRVVPTCDTLDVRTVDIRKSVGNDVVGVGHENLGRIVDVEGALYSVGQRTKDEVEIGGAIAAAHRHTDWKELQILVRRSNDNDGKILPIQSVSRIDLQDVAFDGELQQTRRRQEDAEEFRSIFATAVGMTYDKRHVRVVRRWRRMLVTPLTQLVEIDRRDAKFLLSIAIQEVLQRTHGRLLHVHGSNGGHNLSGFRGTIVEKLLNHGTRVLVQSVRIFDLIMIVGGLRSEQRYGDTVGVVQQVDLGRTLFRCAFPHLVATVKDFAAVDGIVRLGSRPTFLKTESLVYLYVNLGYRTKKLMS